MFEQFTTKGTQLMAIYQPYFYIIQDIRNGMYYAGAKWAQGCHPEQLLKEGGYPTSSETIKKIIDENGLDTFAIRKIRTFKSSEEAYDYETRFLVKVDAKNHPRFYNGHNNKRPPAYGTQGFIDIMISKYGVTHPIYSSDITQKRKETNVAKYGVEHYSQTDEYKEKYKNTSLEKYGVEHPLQSPEIREKGKNTNLEKYGVEHAMQNKSIREKGRKTNLVRNGSETYNNRDLAKETYYKNYGVDHYTKTPENRAILSSLAVEREQKIKNKPQVILLKKYIEKYGNKNIGCGRGWFRKSDTHLEILIKNAILKYGEL
jgi:hypothetical protein